MGGAQAATVPASGARDTVVVQTGWRKWGPDVLGVLAVVGIALLLGHRLLGPKVSTPGGVVANFSPFNVTAPARTQNWILTDVVMTTYPNRTFVNTSLQHGHFPLWNPLILGGDPAAADPLMALFYPTTLALGWLSAGHALDMEILIHLVLAATGMYALVRVWGGKHLGAVAAAAAFTGCSALTVWQQYQNGFTGAVWLPWLVLCFVLAQRGRRLLWIGAGAVILGLMILSNNVQLLLYDLLLLGCYALFMSAVAIGGPGWRRLITGHRTVVPADGNADGTTRVDTLDWRRIVHPLVDLAAIVMVGFGIGAVQFLPELQFAALSPRTDFAPYSYVRIFVAPWQRLFCALAPNFFGTPAVLGTEWFPYKSNYPESVFYVGFFPLLLALTAPLWRRIPRVWFLWGFSFFIAAMVYGTPLLHLYALVPVLQALEVSRMTYLMCFCGAALCGLVLDDVFATARKWLPLLVIGGLALLGRIILHLTLAHYRPTLPDAVQKQPSIIKPTTESLHWVTILVLIGAAIFAVAILRSRVARLIAPLAFTVLIVVDIAHTSLPYNAATVKEDTLYPRPQVFDSLPQSVAPARVVPINQPDSDGLLPPDMLEVFGIAGLGADQSTVPGTYLQYFRAFEPKPFIYNNAILVNTQYDSPLLDVAGVEYFVSNVPLDTLAHPLKLVASAQTLYLYRNPRAAPRVFITASVEPVVTEKEALQTLTAPGFTPCGVATVEGANVSLPTPSQPGCIGTAMITKYEPNVVHVHAETPTDGFLVLSDAYYPGWKVTVDGKTQPLYRADGVFRGVQLPAGAHEVQFVFRPPRVIIGGVISLVGILSALLLVVVGFTSERRRTRGEKRRQPTRPLDAPVVVDSEERPGIFSVASPGSSFEGREEGESRGMRKGMPPGVLIGLVFAVIAVLFGAVILAATRGPSSPAASPSAGTANGAPTPQAVPTIALATLNKSPSETFFFIDALNTTSLLTPPPAPITVATGGEITLTGWAVDTTAGKAAGGVVFSVDGAKTFQATYGIDRPDVAAVLKNDAYRHSGFSATFPASTLTPGRHTITIKIIAADLKSYYAPSQEIVIEIV